MCYNYASKCVGEPMDIKELLHGRDVAFLRSVLRDYSIFDICELCNQLKPQDKAILFQNIDDKRASLAFSYLNGEDQRAIAQHITDKELMNIIKNMQADDSADFLEEMPSKQVNDLLKSLDKKTRDKVNKLLTFEQETVGSIMNLDYVSLQPSMTVAEAFAKIKKEGIYRETIYTCYVVDNNNKLIGIVSVKDMLMADTTVFINELMQKKIVHLYTSDDQERAAYVFNKYGLLALPVVDSNNVLVGIVTFDDVFDVIEDEATEDIQKMAGLTKSDTSYFSKSIWDHARHRVSWLIGLMLTAMASVFIINSYSNILPLTPLLLAFIPMLMDTGGNCGSQSSTLIIRGITTHEIKFSDIFKVMWIELRVALLVSSILALISGFNIYLMYENIALAIAVAISLVITVVLSKLIGAVLPLFAHKLKLDPAIAATPLITTIVDIIAILIYFNVILKILF